jgi:hypothetical protein
MPGNITKADSLLIITTWRLISIPIISTKENDGTKA